MNQADAEVIKQLELLIEEIGKEEWSFESVILYGHLRNVLNLINRQKAEIERRKNNLFCKVEIDEETMRNIVKEKVAEFELDIKSIKAEAIKEFVERLKDKIGVNCDLVDVYEHIDNLVKEMVGDTE